MAQVRPDQSRSGLQLKFEKKRTCEVDVVAVNRMVAVNRILQPEYKQEILEIHIGTGYFYGKGFVFDCL